MDDLIISKEVYLRLVQIFPRKHLFCGWHKIVQRLGSIRCIVEINKERNSFLRWYACVDTKITLNITFPLPEHDMRAETTRYFQHQPHNLPKCSQLHIQNTWSLFSLFHCSNSCMLCIQCIEESCQSIFRQVPCRNWQVEQRYWWAFWNESSMIHCKGDGYCWIHTQKGWTESTRRTFKIIIQASLIAETFLVFMLRIVDRWCLDGQSTTFGLNDHLITVYAFWESCSPTFLNIHSIEFYLFVYQTIQNYKFH